MSLQATIDTQLRRRGENPFRLEVDLDLGDGVTVVVGASGSGKTTLLTTLLGARRPDRGRIELNRKTLLDTEAGIDVPIAARGIGMVFQEIPLFPHLDVGGNVAVGLQPQTGSPRRQTAERWLDRVGAAGWHTRSPGTLSGGERQRVALARALAADPKALLLDEPFSALDRAGRGALGKLLRDLAQAAAIPFVHVTHDLEEAVRVGDRLILLKEGRVLQSGSPAQVLSTPETIHAAHAVGIENLFTCKLVAQDAHAGCSIVQLEDGPEVRTSPISASPGEELLLALRAQDVLIAEGPVTGTSARNCLAGTVRSVTPLDRGLEIQVDTPLPFRAMVTPASADELSLRPGRSIHLLIKASAFRRLR